MCSSRIVRTMDGSSFASSNLAVPCTHFQLSPASRILRRDAAHRYGGLHGAARSRMKHHRTFKPPCWCSIPPWTLSIRWYAISIRHPARVSIAACRSASHTWSESHARTTAADSPVRRALKNSGHAVVRLYTRRLTPEKARLESDACKILITTVSGTSSS